MKKFCFLILGLTTLSSFSATAFGAASVVVGACKTGVQFATIQGAVSASPAGSLISVCPGLYPEQVTINKAMTIKGIPDGLGGSAAVIVAPVGGIVPNAVNLSNGLPIAAQILVTAPSGSVALSNLVVDGSNNQISGCAPILIGIYYQNASGSLGQVAVLNEALSSGLNGCQSGDGVYVQSGGGGTSTVSVLKAHVQNYQKNGITGNGLGTTLNVTSSTVVGQGPTTGAAENGIQIGFGSKGTVAMNTVSDDVYSPGTAGASGILVYESPNIVVKGNAVTNTQYGIVFVTDAGGSSDGAMVQSNKVVSTHLFDGIDMCNNNNNITGNTVISSDESGIHLDSTCGGTGNSSNVTGNTLNVACAGILNGGMGNNIMSNTYTNVTNTVLASDVCSTPLLSRNKTRRPQPVR